MERMKYFKCEGVVISSYNLEMATNIYKLACWSYTDEIDIVEISKYEALGLLVESLVNNDVLMDAVAIKTMFDDARNEIVTFY